MSRIQSSGDPERGIDIVDYYTAAIQSFQRSRDLIEKAGRKDSSEWYLANGLVRLSQAIKEDRHAEADRQRSYARTDTPHN
jgi:hypothetical protein